MGAKQSRGDKSKTKVDVDSGAGTGLGRCNVGVENEAGVVQKRQRRRVTFTPSSPEVLWIPRRRPTGVRDAPEELPNQ